MPTLRHPYEPYPSTAPDLPAITLDIEELEALESPDWVTMGSLAAGGCIFLAAVTFAVVT